MRAGRSTLRDETGDATVDFVLIGALLTVLTLAVIQLGLALLIRNTVLDAAAEGARYAALADNGLDDGAQRTRDLITSALGPGYAGDIRVSYQDRSGIPAVDVTVRAPLPLLGLVGIDHGMEVHGHAALESLG